MKHAKILSLLVAAIGMAKLLCAASALAMTNAPPEAAQPVTAISGSAMLIAPPPGGPTSGSVMAEAQMIPAPPPTVYRADDGRCLRVLYQPAMSRAFAILWDDTSVALPQVVSASGMRFSDGTWTVWSKGKSVMVLDEKAGRILFEGVEQPRPDVTPEGAQAVTVVSGSAMFTPPPPGGPVAGGIMLGPGMVTAEAHMLPAGAPSEGAQAVMMMSGSGVIAGPLPPGATVGSITVGSLPVVAATERSPQPEPKNNAALVVEMKRTYDDAPTGMKDNLPLKLAWSNVVFSVDEGVGGFASVGICRIHVFPQSDMTNAIANVVRERDGGVVQAWVTDLDGDGRPEVLVWIQCAGSGAYGTLEAFTFDGKKLTKFFVPPLLAREAPSYHGHDWFEVKNGKLLCGFRRYTGAEPNEAEHFGGEARFELDVKNKCWRQIIAEKKQP